MIRAGPSKDGVSSHGSVLSPIGLAPARADARTMRDQPPNDPSVECECGPGKKKKKKVPIIFVPGVMGSRLYFPASDAYWDPDHTYTRMNHWLTIGSNQMRKEMYYKVRAEVMTTADDLSPSQTARGWAGLAKDFYRGILSFLAGLSFTCADTPVYAVGYDWRQDNRLSGQYVEDKINSILATEGASNYILVSHSMGGLVTRSALKQGSIGSKALGVIHIFQPVTGAVVNYRRFYSGVTVGYDGYKLRLLFGSKPEDYVNLLSAMPGPVQLLPNNDYRDTGDKPWLHYRDTGQDKPYRGDVFDMYSSGVRPTGLIDFSDYGKPDERIAVKNELMSRVAEAKAFHSWLGSYKHGETWSIYGTNLATDMAVVFDPPTCPKPRFTFHVVGNGQVITIDHWKNNGAVAQNRSEGDGTVPATSGAALFSEGQTSTDTSGSELQNDGGKRQGRVEGAAHDKACDDGGVHNMVLAILRKLLP